ncbi:MAG: nucleotidyltransferase family protein [Sphingomonadales bacterium]
MTRRPGLIPSRAMVLAAGLGLRMRPLTDDRPKAMIEVDGRSLIDRAIDRLADAGIKQIVVNLHYKASLLKSHLASREAGPAIQFSDETELLLETGGGVRAALDRFEGQPFFVINSDVIWLDGVQNTLLQMAARWDPEVMDALLLMVPTVGAVGYDGTGDFTMTADGHLTRKAESRVAPYLFGGIQILDERSFVNTPDGPFSLNLLYDRAQGRNRLFGSRHEGLWLHVGAPESIAPAARILKSAGGPP